MPLQLGLGLNRRLGGFNPFTPTHLNPYLLFDTRTSMLGELESPTLDLDAAVPSSLDVITATRSGVATYTDINGNIQTADPNTVRVDYVQGEELTPTKYQNIPYTDFSSGWSNYLTSDTAGGGYNGYPSRVVTADSNTAKYFTSIPSVNNVTYTLSFYIRRISGSGTISCFHSSAANGNQTDITATSEWTRQEVTYLGDGGNISAGVRIVTAGDVVEIAMPQVEEGTTASDFVPNTTGSPKFIASATYGPRVPMMLIEPSATNLLDYSEDFSEWQNDGHSQTIPNEIISPDGLNNGVKLNTFNVINQSYVGKYTSVTASTTYTFSVYAKKGEQKYVCLVGLNPFTESYFDLESGTALSNNATSSRIEDVGDGWFRLSATFDAQTSSKYTGISLSKTGSTLSAVDIPTGEGVYIWGAQLEQGSVATSYIPTSGSAVTRNADNLVIDGTAFSDFYNDSEGTIYCEFVYDFDPAYEYLYVIKESPTDEIRTQLTTGDDIRTRYTVANSHIGVVSPNGTVRGSLNRHAYSYKTDNFRASINGTAESEDLTGTVSLSPSSIKFGQRSGVLETTKFKRFIYWPTHSDSL